MTQLAQYDNNQGLTQRQTISGANAQKLVLSPNTEFDRRLVKTEIWKGERELYPAWTGTHVTYEKQNKKMGATVVYTDPETGQRYVFDVKASKPSAMGEKNIALVINHGFTAEGKPLFDLLEDGKDLVVKINDSGQLKIKPFPTQNGWHLTDEDGIPNGKEVSPNNPDARRIWRLDDAYVGLLARFYVFGVDDRRVVYAYVLPSVRLVVLESEAGATAPAAGLFDIKALAVNAEKAIMEFANDARFAPVRELIAAAKQ